MATVGSNAVEKHTETVFFPAASLSPDFSHREAPNRRRERFLRQIVTALTDS